MNRLNIPGIAFLVAIALVWQVAATAMGSPTFPPFTKVVATFFTQRGELFDEMLHTLLRAVSGFAIAFVTMLPLGIILGRVRILGEMFDPVIELVRPLPAIAVVPVSMIFFGIGDTAKIAVVVYGAAFPILINAIDAVRSLDPMMSHVARSLHLTRFERKAYLDFPATLPRIVTGIRLSIALSILLSVVAEMLLSTDGIGAYLVRAQESFRLAEALAALVLTALIAVLANMALELVERRALAWHHARVRGRA